jgi:hypothetical protein
MSHGCHSVHHWLSPGRQAPVVAASTDEAARARLGRWQAAKASPGWNALPGADWTDGLIKDPHGCACRSIVQVLYICTVAHVPQCALACRASPSSIPSLSRSLARCLAVTLARFRSLALSRVLSPYLPPSLSRSLALSLSRYLSSLTLPLSSLPVEDCGPLHNNCDGTTYLDRSVVVSG